MTLTKKREGPHFKFLILLSIPSILSCILEPLGSLIDTFYAGHLGTRYVATMAVAAAIFNSFTWIFSFLVHVSTQAISFRQGARQYKKAINLFKISLLASFSLGVLSAIILSWLAPGLLDLAGATPQIVTPLKEYFFLRLWGQPVLLMGLVIIGTLRAYGKVGKAFAIGAIAVSANALISGLLIFVMGWGIKGAARGYHLFLWNNRLYGPFGAKKD